MDINISHGYESWMLVNMCHCFPLFGCAMLWAQTHILHLLRHQLCVVEVVRSGHGRQGIWWLIYGQYLGDVWLIYAVYLQLIWGFPWVHTWLMMINIWLIYGSSWDNISLYDGSQWVIIWVKECHKPPIWEWFIPNLFLVIWMMFRYCFTHIRGTDPTPRNLT